MCDKLNSLKSNINQNGFLAIRMISYLHRPLDLVDEIVVDKDKHDLSQERCIYYICNSLYFSVYHIKQIVRISKWSSMKNEKGFQGRDGVLKLDIPYLLLLFPRGSSFYVMILPHHPRQGRLPPPSTFSSKASKVNRTFLQGAVFKMFEACSNKTKPLLISV